MKPDTLTASCFGWLAFMTVVWGTSWPILKIALSEIPPWTFRGAIAPVAALFLFGIGYLLKERITAPRDQWGPLIVASVLNITGWHIASAFGLTLLTSGHASIIAYTMPLWAILISMLLIGERPTAKRLIGLILGMAGMAVLLSGELGVFAASPLGTFYMILSAIFWGAGTVVHKRTQWSIPPTSLAGWQLLIGGLPITIVALFIDLPNLEPVSALATWSMIYILVVAIILCWVAWFNIVHAVSVTVASVSTLLIPVIGVISGAVVLGEPVGEREVAALILVCGALALVLTPASDKGQNRSNGVTP